MKKYLVLLVCFMCVMYLGAQDHKGYKGYVDFAIGDAYNLNTAQTISTNNMQWYSMISTTHGYQIKSWFVGAGMGYYHSYRDKENMYPFYLAGRYTFNKARLMPYVEARTGIVYDPYWISTIQAYGALSVGIKVYKGFQVGLGGSIFSRPSRYFTANAAVILSYSIGK